MRSLSKTNLVLLTVAAFYAFFVFGFSDNLKGPVLPALLQDLKLNYALGGTILMGIYLGFMSASITTGFIANAYGEKVVLLLAGICMAVGMSGFTVSRVLILLVFWMIILGFGLSSLELGCNSLIVRLYPSRRGLYLNLMAFMHGLGSMIALLYAGWLLSMGYSWRIVYRWPLI